MENSKRLSFGSDNHSGVHPEIWQAMAAVNTGHVPAYESDEISARAHDVLRTHFGAAAKPHFVFTGTAANVLALRTITESFHAVICSDCAHILCDECGAPERAGLKLLPVPSENGKITIEGIARYLTRRGDQHVSQPRVLSLTQPTEYGTVYSLPEIRALTEFAHRQGLLVHMDGARLVNAAAYLGVSLKEMTTDAGVDVVSFGGTKNGLMFGEAVVFLRPELAENFRFMRKQAMQTASKTRFLAAQFSAWLQGDLWLEIARHANRMAQVLRESLIEMRFVEITRPTEANAVFARLPLALIAPLQEQFSFYVWNEDTLEVRLMTNFDTQPEDIDLFISTLKQLAIKEGLL